VRLSEVVRRSGGHASTGNDGSVIAASFDGTLSTDASVALARRCWANRGLRAPDLPLRDQLIGYPLDQLMAKPLVGDGDRLDGVVREITSSGTDLRWAGQYTG